MDNYLGVLRKRTAAAGTPQEKGRVVEGVVGTLNLVGAMTDAKSELRQSIEIAVSGLLHLLERYYEDIGRFDDAVRASEGRPVRMRSGGVLFREARARALSGKRKSALKALASAIEAGFDDGSRLDGEKGFEELRGAEGFAELRKRCR